MELQRVINSRPYTLKQYWALLKTHKTLIRIFALQEIKTMYAQTYLGLVWAVVRPLVSLIIFTIIFSYFLKVKTATPYYLFAFTGMIAWNLFSQLTTQASSAILQKQYLIRKLFFPKMVLFLSKVIIVLIEFGVSLSLLLVFLLFDNVPFGIHLLALPAFLLLDIILGLTIALWMSSFTIRFRDLNQLLPTIIGIGIWVTPVFFPSTIIPEKYNFFVFANPMGGIIKGFRYALLGEPFPELAYWWAILVVIVLFFVGVWYFIQKEDNIVDYV